MKTAICDTASQTDRGVLPRRIYAHNLKRIADLVTAIIMLPALLPIIALLWVWVRRDGGPGFFVQPRIGRDGRVFQCWKLRSMVVDAEAALKKMCDEDPVRAHEWHVNQKLDVDPRITRAGRFLRKTSLDELPQIFNVLRGDMSFVGPRPFLPEQENLYREAGGKAYYLMRPGITGLWQVKGRSATSFVDRVSYDNTYHKGLTMRSDVALMWQTVAVVLRCTGK